MRFHVVLDGDSQVHASTLYFEDAQAVLNRYISGRIVSDAGEIVYTKKGQ